MKFLLGLLLGFLLTLVALTALFASGPSGVIYRVRTAGPGAQTPTERTFVLDRDDGQPGFLFLADSEASLKVGHRYRVFMAEELE